MILTGPSTTIELEGVRGHARLGRATLKYECAFPRGIIPRGCLTVAGSSFISSRIESPLRPTATAGLLRAPGIVEWTIRGTQFKLKTLFGGMTGKSARRIIFSRLLPLRDLPREYKSRSTRCG